MLNYYRQPRLFRKFADLRMFGGGAVAKTKLRKFATIKLEQNQTDITSGDNDKRFDAAKKSNAVRDILKPAKCEPTEILLELMSKDPVLRQKVARIQKEYEIYEYFSEFIPTRFTDKNWLYLLRTTSIRERVAYWWFMGLTHSRQLNDIEMKRQKAEEEKCFLNESQRKFDNGEMAYCANFYRLLYSPNTPTMSRIFSTLNAIQLGMQELPQLLFDCQFLPQQNPYQYSRTMQSAYLAYYVNYLSRTPFPSAFINVDLDNLTTKNFIKKIHDGKLPYIGNLDESGVEHEKSDFIEPDIYNDNPFHDPRETNPKEQIIYISRYAKELLDGPLIHRAYVLPFTFDRSQETIRAIRRGRYRAMALPIDKYVKWRSGGRGITFYNIVKILREVANNGGDWARALHMHIPFYNRLSTEERREKNGYEWNKKLVEDRKLKWSIGDYIHQTLGKQPAAFAHGSIFVRSATLKEYANRLERF